MLESGTASNPLAISAVPAKGDPGMVEIGAAPSRGIVIPALSRHHVAASMSAPIRGPSVPLFLQNLSLLI